VHVFLIIERSNKQAIYQSNQKSMSRMLMVRRRNFLFDYSKATDIASYAIKAELERISYKV
jgi:hypothetical protein